MASEQSGTVKNTKVRQDGGNKEERSEEEVDERSCVGKEMVPVPPSSLASKASDGHASSVLPGHAGSHHTGAPLPSTAGATTAVGDVPASHGDRHRNQPDPTPRSPPAPPFLTRFDDAPPSREDGGNVKAPQPVSIDGLTPADFPSDKAEDFKVELVASD